MCDEECVMKIVKRSVSDEETQYSPKSVSLCVIKLSDKWYLINVCNKKSVG